MEASSKIGRNVYSAFVASTSFTPFNFAGSTNRNSAKWIFPVTHSWVRSQCACVGEPKDIQSPKNPRVKEAKSLLQRRQREKRNLILLEGQRLISDAIGAGVHPQQLFMTREACQRNEAIADIRRAAADKRALQFFVTDPIMQSITDTVTPQGIVAICERPSIKLPPKASLMLICDGVQDPGNLGTLLRSAAASGADAVVTMAGSADVWGLKVLRAGMGAQFHVPVKGGVSWDELEAYAAQSELTLHVASGSKASRAHWSVDWRKPSGLVIGSEACGASEEAMAICKGNLVKVPMSADIESLNAGMAGTVVLFEASRQRHELQQLHEED